jgi:cytochrome c6
MKRITGSAMVLVLLAPGGVCAAENDGRSDFEMLCSGCHPQGGNSLNPAKTLRKMDREANGIRTAADIVKIMRKPGPGMRAYTKDDLSNKRAKALADYILKTF